VTFSSLERRSSDVDESNLFADNSRNALVFPLIRRFVGPTNPNLRVTKILSESRSRGRHFLTK